MERIPQTLEMVDVLRRNCHIGKHRHFYASVRTNHLHIWLGVPSVLISVALGSTLFTLASKELPPEIKWVGAFLALVAASLGAMQTFFNFQKISESHRTVANQYLGIERQCNLLIAAYCDNLADLVTVSKRLEELNSLYHEVNKAAEGLRTNDKDYAEARKRLTELQAMEASCGMLLAKFRATSS